MSYLRKYLGIHSLFKENIKNFKHIPIKKNITLSNEEVTCICPTYDESLLIKYALESTKDFVDRYIIIDKDGKTVPNIKEAIDEFSLDVEIHIKPELNRLQSRDFAIKKTKSKWIFLQDGDEVFYTKGLYSIHNLRKLMVHENILICAPKLLLYKTLRSTLRRITLMPPHPILIYNNGTFSPQTNPALDIPKVEGWRMGLPYPVLFNCRLKRSSDKELLVPYDPEKYYPYPSIVKRMMRELDPKYV